MNRLTSNNVTRGFSKIGISNVVSKNAILASSHPIASSIGLDVLKMEGMQ